MEPSRLEIARRLALQEFNQENHNNNAAHADPLDHGSISSSTSRPVHRPADVLCDPRNKEIFSHEIERRFVTQYYLNEIPGELKKMMRHASVGLQKLVKTLRRMLKASLFGCEVNIGISPTAGTQVLEFIDDSDNKRRVRRGQSTCFECIDQSDIVLQVSSIQQSKQSTEVALNDGETVIYIPLIARAGPMGVVEIHGLQSPTVTNTANFERDTDLLKSLINAKDYSFVEHTKLWRLPKDRTGGVVSVHDTKDYTYAAYQVVAGSISEVVTEQNGVPFFGGARYDIVWEDGLIEKNVVASELLRTYKNTPQSLGCTSVVTEDLLQDLFRHMTNAAYVLESQRTAEALRRTEASVNFPNLRDVDIMDRALGAVTAVVQRLREVIVLGLDCATGEPGSFMEVPESAIHILQKKSPQLKVQIKGLKQTSRSAIQQYCASPVVSEEFADLIVYNNMNVIPDSTDGSNEALWVTKEMIFPNYFRWSLKSSCRRFFLVVLKLRNSDSEATRGDLQCIEDVSNILIQSLTITCKKELRKKKRRSIMQGVEKQLNVWRSLPTEKQIADEVIQVASLVCPGVNIYVALLSPGGKHLTYIACSENSQMLGKVLRAGEGVSFGVAENQESLLIEKGFDDKKSLISVGDNVNVRYGKVDYKAKILRDRGHCFFDVAYSDTDKEVAVPIDRISPLVAAFKMKSFGSFSFPLLIVPARHRTKSIGVIGMDSFTDTVERAPYDPQPEPGLKLFLEHLGKVLGSCIDIHRKRKSIRDASGVSRNAHSSNADLFKALFDVVFENLLYAISAAVVSIRAADKDGKRHVDILNQSGAKLSKSMVDTLATYDSLRSSQKPVQLKGKKTVWLLCHVKVPAGKTNNISLKLSRKNNFATKDYIFAINCSEDIDDVDTEFLHSLQKFATMVLQNMETRKRKAEIRTDSLSSIKSICDSWENYVRDRDLFFSEISEAIGTCYMSANVYAGKLLKTANAIEYVMASQFSSMKGKVLRREAGKGLSFAAVDSFKHVVVTKSDTSLFDKLHHFGPREATEYPFVAVPIATHLDSPLGVLAADGLEDITQGDENPNEVVSFMHAVSSHVGIPMKKFFCQDITDQLLEISTQCESFEESFERFRDIILSILPFSKDVFYTSFMSMQEHHKYIEYNKIYQPPIRTGLVFIIQFLESECLIDFVRTPILKVVWKNSVLLSKDCHSIGLAEDMSSSICIIKIPEGTEYGEIALSIFLHGTIDNKKRELSRRSMTLQDMSNIGAQLVEYDFESQYAPLPYAHVGRLKFISRLYTATDIIRISIRRVSCQDLKKLADDHSSKAEEDNSMDPYCVFRSKDVEIGRTSAIRNSSNPVWENVEVVLQPAAEDINSPELTISLEVWDTDALGRGMCIGLCHSSPKALVGGGGMSSHVLNHFDSSEVVGSMLVEVDALQASGIDKGTAVEELKIPFLSTTIANSGENLEEAVDLSELEAKDHRCELRMQSIIITQSSKYITKIDIEEEGIPMYDLKPFCVVFLNGSEIGRTSSASIVNQDQDQDQDQEGSLVNERRTYIWDSETVLIEIGSKISPDNCKVRIEVWVIDETDKGVNIGFMNVEGKSFTSLLCTALQVSKWQDVQSCEKNIYSCGEILLSGRPLDAKLSHAILPTEPIPNPRLELAVESVCVVFSSEEEESKSHDLRVTFNDSLLLACDLTSILSGQMTPLASVVEFTRPYNVGLRQSTLKFEVFELSNDKPIIKGVLEKEQLVEFLAEKVQRKREVKLQFDKDTCYGEETTHGNLVLRGGGLGADIAPEVHMGKMGVDILGATGLFSPAYYNLRRPNSYCKIFWNEELVGQTAISWNSNDPIWKLHRFSLPIPISGGQNAAADLKWCSLRVEAWAVKSLDDRNEELLGCVILDGGKLISSFSPGQPILSWYSLEMSSSYALEDQEYVCSKKGAVKIRMFDEMNPVNKSNNFEDNPGGEYLIKIHEARGLAEIDHFSKTNAVVIIYWNNAEIGRTIVAPSTTNPSWEEEVFFVRTEKGGSLQEQELQLHVYDTTGDMTGDFLGYVDVSSEGIVNFFSNELGHVEEFSLQRNPEMDDSDNRHVSGSLFVSAEVVTVQPAELPVDLYSKATLYIMGALDLMPSNVIQDSADAMCIVYWSSLFHQVNAKEVGRTQPVGKSLNPIWQGERFLIDVPVIDEWGSISLQIEIRDVAGHGDSTYLGGIILTGDDLKSLLSRPKEDSSVQKQYKLIYDKPLVLSEFSSYIANYEGRSEVTNSFLVLAGGKGTDITVDTLKSKMAPSENNSSAVVKSKGMMSGLKSNISAAMKQRTRKRESKSVEVRIHEIGGIYLSDSMLPEEMKGMRNVSKQLHYTIRFNDQEKQISVSSGLEKVSNSVLQVMYSSEPLLASFPRPLDEDVSTSCVSIELWLSCSDNANSHRHCLGILKMEGEDMVSIFRPKAPSKSFTLQPNKNCDDDTNKHASGSYIVLSGLIPPIGTKNTDMSSRTSASVRTTRTHDEPDNEPEEKIEVHVCEASGLFKATSLLGSLQEFRADVYWNGELKGSTSSVKSTPSTLISAGVDAIWDNEFVSLSKSKEDDFTESKLTIEICSSSSFAGCFSLEGEALLDFLEKNEPELYDLTTSTSRPLSQQKHIQGKIFMKGRVVSGAEAIVEDDSSGNNMHEFDTSKALPDGMKDLKFFVNAARDLGKADKFGKSDPYCVVKWNGVEIGKTDVQMKTLNPVWNSPFLIRTYKNLGPKDGGQSKSLLKSFCPQEMFNLGSGGAVTMSSTSRRRQVQPIAAVTKDTFQARTDLVLEVEVWDWNAMGNSVFLGRLELSGPSLASMFDCKSCTRYWYKLEKHKKLSRASNKFVNGAIEVSVCPAQSPKETNNTEFCLEVEIIGAKELSKVDKYSQADPYCVLYWSEEFSGKTQVCKNTLSPEWENEVFDIRLRDKTSIDEGYLYIEMWDFDVGMQDKFLGSCLIKGNKLSKLIEKGTKKWIELTRSPFLSDALQNLDISGSIQLRVCPARNDKIRKTDGRTSSFDLTVVGAENLSCSSGEASIDTLCILKVNGREVGTSATFTNSSSPSWNEKFPLVLDSYLNNDGGEECDARISVEVWSIIALARGEFLGVVNLSYQDLLALSKNCRSLKLSEREKAIYQLGKTSALPDRVQSHITGNIKLSARHFGNVDLKELGATAAGEVKVEWPVETYSVSGRPQGLPSFEISILSIKDLIVPTKGKSKVTPDPFCIVYFNGQEVGTTPVCSNTTDPVWSNPDPISVKIPDNVANESFWVSIEVYNMRSLDRGEFLGQISLSFWSLFCLYYGEYTLQLEPSLSNKSQYIKGKLTFSIDIHSPIWNGVKCYTSPGIERTISVLHASGLPTVNNALPSTKCVIHYDGGIKVRSSLATATTGPVWLPRPTLDVTVDYRIPKPVLIQIIFVDVKEKREFCLGEVSIPFECIVRPPAEPIELWLTEPFKSPPKGYNFLLDGSITMRISHKSSVSTWMPWCCRKNKPLLHYPVEQVELPLANKKSSMKMSYDELLWVGTAVNFTSPQIIAGKPELLFVPIKDMGAIVDGRFIGSNPRKQYGFAVRRSGDKLPSSDPLMVMDNVKSIQQCLVSLRRKHLYSHIREVSLAKLKLFLETMIRKNRFDLSAIFKRVSQTITTCFPGSNCFIAIASKDYKCMRYALFEKSFENEEAPSFFTLWEGEGLEWNCVGRHCGQGSIVSHDDIKQNDKNLKPVAFGRFCQFRPPRICSPLVCGDVSLGVVGIEKFDVCNASGSSGNAGDVKAMQAWLDAVGDQFGKTLYIGRERNVTILMETYALLSSSSVSGLLKVLLENCLQVLQGCRLMEIWSLHGRSLTSLATSWPDSVSFPSKWVSIQSIRVQYLKSGALKDEIRNVGKKLGKILFGSKNTEEKAVSPADGEKTVASALKNKACGFVLGTYYGGFEQFQYVEYFDSSKKRVEDFDHTFDDIKVYIGNDRDIWLTVYCIDKELTILEQWSGKFQMVSFKEKKMSVNLSNGDSDGFHLSSTLQWPSKVSAAVQRSIEMKALAEVRSFTLVIHEAHELQKTDLVGSSDPFCEVYWCNELIGKTHVIKDNLHPVWEETFVLEPPAAGKNVDSISCRIEVWDMDFLGKGDFLGEVVIPLDQMLQPPTSDIEISLCQKDGFNRSENKHVGGTLVLSQTVEKAPQQEETGKDDDDTESSDSESDSESEGDATKTKPLYDMSKAEKHHARKLLDIEDPVLKLNIAKAFGLAKADLLGSASPYVKIYRLTAGEYKSSKQSGMTKDPIAVSRVIEKTLNPVWNDELTLSLGTSSASNKIVESTKEKAQGGSLDEWPIFVLEVWSKVKVGDGSFLGVVHLTPPQYALRPSINVELSPYPHFEKKGNKNVQGSIILDFKVVGGERPDMLSSFYFYRSKYLLQSTYVTVSIVSAQTSAVAKTGLRKKTVNPFCILRWQNNKIGETSVKKNTSSPSWANEKFSINVTKPIMASEWPVLILEVWNYHSDESTLLGEVTVPMVELLHPRTGSIIRDIIEPMDENAQRDRSVKGTLKFRLMKHTSPQRISPRLKYVHCYPLNIKSFDKRKNDPILKHYGKENPKVIMTNPVKLEVIRDLNEELKRQRNENIELPGVLNQIEDLNRKYYSSMFDQVGLISEVHYGQTLSAVERNAATILHVQDCDCFLLPTSIDRTDSSEIKSENQAPSVITVTQKKKKKKGLDIGNGDLCLVSRYAKDKVPRQDVIFLKKMRDVISKSILLFEQRFNRKSGRQDILHKLRAVGADIHRYSPGDIIISTIADITSQFSCEVDLFLLQRSHDCVGLKRCSRESGCATEYDINDSDTHQSELINASARLNRHGLLLRFYRGNITVANMGWKSGFSEASLLPFASIREDVRIVESKKLVGKIKNLSAEHAPMGMCITPIMVKDEFLFGVLSISGTDKLPHSIYRLAKDESLISTTEGPTEDDINTVQLFEEGTTECIRDIGLELGEVLLSSTRVSILRDIKTYPVRDDTDPDDVLRYCFRKLVEMIPIIQQISIWKVSTSKQHHSNEDLIMAGYFNSENVEAILSTPDEKIAHQELYSMSKSKPTELHNADLEQAKQRLAHAKNAYASTASWKTALPAMLSASDEEENDISTRSDVSSRKNDSVISSSSNSDGSSDDSSSESESETNLKLAKSKSLFGGFLNTLRSAPSKISDTKDSSDMPRTVKEKTTNPVVLAHTEISRCRHDLNMSSFHIHTNGGARLSLIPNKSNAVGKLFDQRFNIHEKSRDEGAVLSSDYRAIEKNPTIPGTNGVKIDERMVHVSESSASPPNLKKAPLPTGKPAKKSASSKKGLSTNTAAPKKESEKEKNVLHEYFVVTKAPGLGAKDGWGVLGNEACNAIDSTVECMIDVLEKILSSRGK